MFARTTNNKQQKEPSSLSFEGCTKDVFPPTPRGCEARIVQILSLFPSLILSFVASFLPSSNNMYIVSNINKKQRIGTYRSVRRIDRHDDNEVLVTHSLPVSWRVRVRAPTFLPFVPLSVAMKGLIKGQSNGSGIKYFAQRKRKSVADMGMGAGRRDGVADQENKRKEGTTTYRVRKKTRFSVSCVGCVRAA